MRHCHAVSRFCRSLAVSMPSFIEEPFYLRFLLPGRFCSKIFRGRGSSGLFLVLVLSPIEAPVLGLLFPFGIAKLGVNGHVMSPSLLLNLGFERVRLFIQFLQGSGKVLAGRLVRVWSRHVHSSP